MTKPVTRPERVSPADLDEAVKAGVERAEKANELSTDDLDDVTGGAVAGRFYEVPRESF